MLTLTESFEDSMCSEVLEVCVTYENLTTPGALLERLYST